MLLCLSSVSDFGPEDTWYQKLSEDFPKGDVGMISFYLLNLGRIEKGEAIFTGAGIPHAYLDGDIVEVMANSDNTVRGGITPKYIDVGTLLEMLTYQSGAMPVVEQESLSDARGVRYKTSADEFVVDRFDGPFATSLQSSLDSLHFCFCLHGEGELITDESKVSFSSGDAFIVPAQLESYSLNVQNGMMFRVSIPIEKGE